MPTKMDKAKQVASHPASIWAAIIFAVAPALVDRFITPKPAEVNEVVQLREKVHELELEVTKLKALMRWESRRRPNP